MQKDEIILYGGFKDVPHNAIIKVPDCAYIHEQNNKRIKKHNTINETDFFYVCGCNTDEFFTICYQCSKECHSKHTNKVKIDIKMSSDLICKCGMNNHLPPKNKKEMIIKTDQIKPKKNCYYSEIVMYTVNKGFFKLQKYEKVYCCICKVKCFSEQDQRLKEPLPSAKSAWSEEGEMYVCECACLNHESPLNFDSTFKGYNDLLLNFNFHILSMTESTKKIFDGSVIFKLITSSIEVSETEFNREYSIIKFLETFYNLTYKNFDRYFYPKDILKDIPLKEVIKQLITIKATDNENTTLARARFSSFVFIIYVKKFFIIENNLIQLFTFLNMNILQRNFFLYNSININKGESFEITEETKTNIKLLANTYLDFLDKILKNFETKYIYRDNSFDRYLLIFNKIFKFFIKYNLIDKKLKMKYFELVYDIYDLANNRQLEPNNRGKRLRNSIDSLNFNTDKNSRNFQGKIKIIKICLNPPIY